MKTTGMLKKGGYKLLGKELFIYYCGNCRTATALTPRGAQKYCHECGFRFNWKKIRRIK